MWNWLRWLLAKRAHRKYAKFLMSFREVLGVTPARVRIKGKPGELIPEICLRIYIRGRKSSPKKLRTEDAFHEWFKWWKKQGKPRRLGEFSIKVPGKLGGIKTDVVCVPEGFQAWAKRKQRGVTILESPSGIDSKRYGWVGAGMAVAGESLERMGSFGTSAWVVIPTRNVPNPGKPHLLTNAHVVPKVGEKAYQGHEVIGTCVANVYPPEYQGEAAPGDFGLIELDGRRPVKQEIVELGRYEAEYHKPETGRIAVKRGVTKYKCAGFVTRDPVGDGPFQVRVSYGQDGEGVIDNSWDIPAQDRNKPHGGPGCSGSGENDNINGKFYPMGELYAGGQDEQGIDHTIFYDIGAPDCPIDKYGLKFDLSSAPEPPPPGPVPPPEDPLSKFIDALVNFLLKYLGKKQSGTARNIARAIKPLELPGWGKVILGGILLAAWGITLVVTAWYGFGAQDFTPFIITMAGSGFPMWALGRILES